MLDWEGNIKEEREWVSQVVIEDVDDHINTSSLIVSAIEKKTIDDEMMHHECQEEETIKYNLPLIEISVIAGISTVLDENILSRMLIESGQLSREKMIIGVQPQQMTHLIWWMILMTRRDTVMTTVTPITVMTAVTPKVVMMGEVHKIMTTNKLMTMTSMKYLSQHWMYQGQEPLMASIFPTFGGLSMRMQRGHWM